MIERWFRSLKEEEVWLKEYRTLAEAQAQIGEYIHFYNEERLHSAVGYRAPQTVHQESLASQAA